MNPGLLHRSLRNVWRREDRRGRGRGRSTGGAQIEHVLGPSGLLLGADEVLEASRLEQVLVGLVEAAVVRRQFRQQLVAARQRERVADVVGNGLGQGGTGPIGLAESDETLAQTGGDEQPQALVGRSGMRGRGEALERPTMIAHGQRNPPGEDERSERQGLERHGLDPTKVDLRRDDIADIEAQRGEDDERPHRPRTVGVVLTKSGGEGREPCGRE